MARTNHDKSVSEQECAIAGMQDIKSTTQQEHCKSDSSKIMLINILINVILLGIDRRWVMTI